MHISNLEDTIVSQVCAYVTIRDVNADYNVLKRLNTKKIKGEILRVPPTFTKPKKNPNVTRNVRLEVINPLKIEVHGENTDRSFKIIMNTNLFF